MVDVHWIERPKTFTEQFGEYNLVVENMEFNSSELKDLQNLRDLFDEVWYWFWRYPSGGRGEMIFRKKRKYGILYLDYQDPRYLGLMAYPGIAVGKTVFGPHFRVLVENTDVYYMMKDKKDFISDLTFEPTNKRLSPWLRNAVDIL